MERVPLPLDLPVHTLPFRVVRRHACASARVLPRLKLLLATLGHGARLGAVRACRAVGEGVYVAADGFAKALYAVLAWEGVEDIVNGCTWILAAPLVMTLPASPPRFLDVFEDDIVDVLTVVVCEGLCENVETFV